MTRVARILLVEDSPQDAQLTLAALEDEALVSNTVVVHDGAEALDYLRGRHPQSRRGELPAVVLLDLKMPKVDGLDVLRQIKGDERLKVVPVVMLTSSREDRDVAASYGAGCNAYVVKHLDFSEFTAAIRALGAFWVGVNQPPPKAAVEAAEEDSG